MNPALHLSKGFNLYDIKYLKFSREIKIKNFDGN